MVRTSNWSLTVAGVAALMFSVAGVAHSASATAADEAAIRAQTASWEKAYNSGDAKGWRRNTPKTRCFFRRARPV